MPFGIARWLWIAIVFSIIGIRLARACGMAIRVVIGR